MKTERYEKALAELSEKMDKRDKFYQELAEFQDRHHFIPPEYIEDPMVMLNLVAYRKLGPWRKQKQVVAKIKKAARRAAKNK